MSLTYMYIIHRLKHTVACMPLIRRVLVRMIGFISSWLHTHSSLHLYTGYTALSLVYTPVKVRRYTRTRILSPH
jgi:hypothetical protein